VSARGPSRRRNALDGVLLFDKPPGITSQKALARVKALLNAAKAGHTGTLDPAATGLLPLAFGEASKFAQSLLDADKAYTAGIRLGLTTTTGDLEGEVISRSPALPDLGRLQGILAHFRGEIEQVPPMYSALKRDGKPLYAYARAGVTLPREARRVTIHALEVLSAGADELVIQVVCSKGTYVRTLAEDIGKAFGCGGCLFSLRRTGVGPFRIEDAVGLETLQSCPEERRAHWLRPVDTLVQDLPSIALTDEQARRMEHGQAIECPTSMADGLVRIYGPGDTFLGVGETAQGGRLAPRRLVAARPRAG
jgi:tRNA pseudouridine55 synthase